jgi:hypothetical protein
MKRENTVTQAENATVTHDQKGEDVFNPKSGKVRGTVWKNVSPKVGVYYKVSVRRVETDANGVEHLANSFWPEDLADLASVATQCRIYLQMSTDVFEKQREWRKERAKRSRKPKASKAAPSDSAE